jgi:hypothetical protein
MWKLICTLATLLSGSALAGPILGFIGSVDRTNSRLTIEFDSSRPASTAPTNPLVLTGSKEALDQCEKYALLSLTSNHALNFSLQMGSSHNANDNASFELHDNDSCRIIGDGHLTKQNRKGFFGGR